MQLSPVSNCRNEVCTDGGTTWMLARQIGKARATEMIMLGERIPAEKAESWGLIHAAVDDAALMARATALAEMKKEYVIAARVAGWTDHPGHSHPSQFLTLA